MLWILLLGFWSIVAEEPDLYINEVYPNAGPNGYIELLTKVGFVDKTPSKFGIALLSLRRHKGIVTWIYDLTTFTHGLTENSYILLGNDHKWI